jgi:hypothetical protein
MKVHVITREMFLPRTSKPSNYGAFSSKKKADSVVDRLIDSTINDLKHYGYERRDTVVCGIGKCHDIVKGDELYIRYKVETMEVE